ncbi:hypothetical protein BCR42DRAFT_426201 [Absidia repens]|uniref:Uncharacterized protein n=1 Tax=Absidia repens TaxID=90262 RepID=A0A1X2I1K6_9FUNG|nr:hypothetical protein BCR42DRAFT_426201 [Absidia repens]
MPKKYSVLRKSFMGFTSPKYEASIKKRLCNALQLDKNSLTIDIVCITYFNENILEPCAERDGNYSLWLVGSFVENKWVIFSMGMKEHYFDKWSHHHNNYNGTVFNIY